MDQAEKLREIIYNLRKKKENNINSPAIRKNARVITVTSGKGGVGKSNITVNLAIALSRMNLRTAIIDADLGLANIEVLLGLSPKFTLLDVVRNNKSIFEILNNGPDNVRYISGGSGIQEIIDLGDKELELFIKNISMLDRIFDIILIDTGAGISEKVLSFVMAADEVLLVTTPEPTSMTDAYALVKMISNKDKTKPLKVIVNNTESREEAEDVFVKIRLVSEKFLNVNLVSLGYIIKDDIVVKAVKNQQPFLIKYPKSNAAKHITEIASKIISENLYNFEENKGFRGFFNKLLNNKKCMN